MPEQWSGGFEYEPQISVEVAAKDSTEHQSNELTRSQLFDGLGVIETTLRNCDRSYGQSIQLDPNTDQPVDSIHALRISLDNIEERSFNLMRPMTRKVLGQTFAFYNTWKLPHETAEGVIRNSPKNLPQVDVGLLRKHRYDLLGRILQQDELNRIISVESLLDSCSAQQEGRGVVAWKLFHAYKVSLGSINPSDRQRPWHDRLALEALFPEALSKSDESGITPIPEISE